MDSRNFANGFQFGFNGMAGIPIHRLFQIPQIPVLQRALMYQHSLSNGYQPVIPTTTYNAMTPDVRNPFLWPYSSTQSSPRASTPSLDSSRQSSTRESPPSLNQSQRSSFRESPPSLDQSRCSSTPPPRVAWFQPWESEASDQIDDDDEGRLIIDLSPQKSPAKEASVPKSSTSEAAFQRRLMAEDSSRVRQGVEASPQSYRVPEVLKQRSHVCLTLPLDVDTPPFKAQREVPGNYNSDDERPQPSEKKQMTSDTPKARDPYKKPDERKYTCQYCDKSFTRTSTRRNHEMRHTGAMPYGCDTCGRRFRQKSNLDRHHLSVHTDLKPFSCRVCHRDFNRACNLRKHLEIHGLKLEEGRGVCLVCGREFMRLAEAVDHIAEEQCVPTQEQRA